MYFTGNGEGQESIHYALSEDGFNYYALNNNQPVLDSKEISTTGGVRDPHILRGEDGKTFYMAVTDLLTENGWDNYAMVLLKSTDLINWTSSKINIPESFPKFKNIERVWAPQTIYDEEKDAYMIYFSMQEPGSYDKIYYVYANGDFTEVSEPEQLFFHSEKVSSIDGDIIKKDGKFHLFYKDGGQENNGIRVAISEKLNGNYKIQPGNADQTDKAVEGSGVFKLLDSDKYILMYDVYQDGEYEFVETTDLQNFQKTDTKVSMDFHPRHGSVIHITSEEASELLKAFP